MKKIILSSVCLLLAVLMILSLGFSRRENGAEEIRNPILLLIEDDTGPVMLQLRLGLQQAASELGCGLTVEVLRQNGAHSTRQDWTEFEFSGAVVCMEDASLRQSALRMLDNRAIPAVVIGSWDGVHSAVCTGETRLGEQAAMLAANAVRVLPAGGSDAARKAAESELGSRAADPSEFDAASPENAILALDSDAAREYCRLKAENGWQCALIAADPGEARAELLEQGTVQALLLTSPYASGYLAAGAIGDRTPRRMETPIFVVDRENMYEARNVKLVFPLLN